MTVLLQMHLLLLFPGFRVVWKSLYLWPQGGRSLSASGTARRGRRSYDIAFPPALRGIYSGLSGVLYLEDLFGFFSFPLFRGEPLSLSVLPLPGEGEFSREVFLLGGETATDDRERVRSDELLEVRKYYPGDDARRINWKLFASSGELFLRIGEEIPPPSGEAVVTLFADSPGIAEMKNAVEHTDRLVGIFLSLVLRFSALGSHVSCLVSPSGKRIAFDREKPEELLEALAGIHTGSSAPPSGEGEFLYCASLPGAAGLENLAARKSGEGAIFLTALLDEPVQALGGFLFMNSGSPASAWREERETAVYRELLDNTSAMLRSVGKGRIHVSIL